MLTLAADIQDVETVVSQSLLNSVLQLAHVWTKANDYHPLTSLYTICNNTHSAIFMKQVGDEMLDIKEMGMNGQSIRNFVALYHNLSLSSGNLFTCHHFHRRNVKMNPLFV